MATDEDGLIIYYGGKKGIADRITQHFPRTATCFVDAFFGGGGIYFAVPDGLYPIRVINDLNSSITTFFRVLRTRTEELIAVCELTPYSMDEQRACRDPADDPSPTTPEGELEMARRVWVRQRQNFGGRQTANSGWRRGTATMSCAVGTANRLLQFRLFAEKMRRVEINNTDATELIGTYSKPGVFIYEDPPYVPESRGSNRDYAHEMSPEQHQALVAATLKAAEAGAHVMISGYASELYDTAYKSWRRIELAHTAGSIAFASEEARSRTEVLWMSYPESLELRKDWFAAISPTSPRERALLKAFRKQRKS